MFLWQGVGKSTLAKNISESWKCILIDGMFFSGTFILIFVCTAVNIFLYLKNVLDTDLLNTHIKNKTKEGIGVNKSSIYHFALFHEYVYICISKLIQYPCFKLLQLLSILFQGKCIPDDVVLELILARINSPDVEHYGKLCSNSLTEKV